MKRAIFGVTALLASASMTAVCPARAQMPGMTKVATVSATAKPGALVRGGKGVLTITVAVAPRFHINAHQPGDPDLVGTDFHGTGAMFGAVRYPAPKTIQAGGKPTRVYVGRSVITVPFTVPKTAKPGRFAVGGSLTYQGCNETMCYPPTAVPIKAVVTVR